MYMRSIRQRSSEMKTHREERNLSIFIVSLIKRVVVKKQDWTKGCDLTVTSQGGLRRAHVLRFSSVSSVLKVPFGEIQGRQVGLLGLPPRTACFQGDGMQKATGRCSVGSLGCQGDIGLGGMSPGPSFSSPHRRGEESVFVICRENIRELLRGRRLEQWLRGCLGHPEPASEHLQLSPSPLPIPASS